MNTNQDENSQQSFRELVFCCCVLYEFIVKLHRFYQNFYSLSFQFINKISKETKITLLRFRLRCSHKIEIFFDPFQALCSIPVCLVLSCRVSCRLIFMYT